MRNLVVAAVVLGVGGFFGAKFYVQYKTAKDLDAMLVQVRPFVDIEYDEVVATLNGELRVEDVTVRMPQFDDSFTVDSVGLQTPGFLFLLGFDSRKLDIPERLGVALPWRSLERGRRLSCVTVEELRRRHKPTPRSSSPRPTGARARPGSRPACCGAWATRQVVADIERELVGATARSLVMSLGTNVENMYDVDVEFTLEGIQDPTAMVRGCRSALLVGGRMDYIDRSLNERIGEVISPSSK